MKANRVVACFGHVEGHGQERTVEVFPVPNNRAGHRMIEGDPILLGVLHSDPPRQAKTLVQTCKYHPLKAAWMAGSCIVGDGSLHMITPIDPLLFIIPGFPRNNRQVFDDRHFCDIEELFTSQINASCQFISGLIQASQLSNICETKAVDNDLYYRFHFDRIVAWLQCKAQQTLKALQTHCPQVLTQDPESDMLYATTMVTEHLSLDWEHHIIQSLGLIACASRPPKRSVADEHRKSASKLAKVEKTSVLSSKQKAQISREASKAAAFSKVAQGSAKIASFFSKR